MRRSTVAPSLLGLVIGCSLTSCGQSLSPEIASPSTNVVQRAQAPHTKPTVSIRPERSSTVPSAAPRRCHADQLRLAVALSASVASQPFDDISITNSGARACALIGYPRVAFAGHRGFSDQPAPTEPVAIRVRHRIYERFDPGPHVVVVPPQHRAFFSVGTADAYDGPLFTLTRLTVIVPGTRSPTTLRVSLDANGPPGSRIPVGVTAINRSPHP